MKARIVILVLIMAGVIALAVVGINQPVAADGGPIPMCGPVGSDKCKLPQEPKKPSPYNPPGRVRKF